ncbi:hypothetical protein [Falsirhodobacter xinxiangensis]|uniref:hypothetical protein n=1 Tax=Falsirhodobacter xinxiangensis TaxID=2530049 RepID=UPI0010AA952F|nr:hypothetical protein [Rhodobacter xinxiangensis]
MQTSVLALALAFSAGASQAATLTFDSLVEYMPEDFTWMEQGFYGDPSMYYTPGEGTIHGPGGPAWPSATIQRDSLFTPLSIDVAGHGGLNEGPQDWEGEIEPFDNLMFEGLIDGKSVAYVAMAMGVGGSSFTYHFGPEFRGINELIISTPLDFVDHPSGLGCADCSAIVYDNLSYTLAPVPLSSSALMLASGLAFAAAIRRRR